MLSVLSETQRAIVEVMTMRLHVPQALEYLKDAGHEMSRAKYFRQRKKIENMKLERMHYIAKYFPDQHLERIDRCELVEKLCWENYHAEKDPTKKVKILESIVNIQPYLSGYYEATKMVLEASVPLNKEPVLEEPILDYVPMVGDEKDKEWTGSEPNSIGNETAVSRATGEITSSLETEDKNEGKGKEKEEEWKQLQCSKCHKWFYNNFTLSAHICRPESIMY